MTCKYVTKKGKTCSIMKVNENGICNKHLKVYENKNGKEMESDPVKQMEKEKKINKVIEKKKKKNIESEKEKNMIQFKDENELDEIMDDEETETESETYSEMEEREEKEIVEKKQKESKAFQLAMLTMAYNTCTSIMERMSEPYLENFSKQCSSDENIKNCLSELNDEHNLEIFMNATPDIKLLFFTGIIAVNKISTAIAIKSIGSQTSVKTFESNEEEQFKDL